MIDVNSPEFVERIREIERRFNNNRECQRHKYVEDLRGIIDSVQQGFVGAWSLDSNGYVVYFLWCPGCMGQLFIVVHPDGEIYAAHADLVRAIPRSSGKAGAPWA